LCLYATGECQEKGAKQAEQQPRSGP
jgi:hypothetical protein